MELLLARNPDTSSSLPYLLRLPLEGGLVFRTKGTWPRTSALYCHPVDPSEWPQAPEIVERVALRSCARRGAAIDVVCDRGREQRSQIVFTKARGRDVVFWQSARTRRQSRPDVSVPTARAQGIEELEILVDAHERYPYRFAGQQARAVRRGLACGDYAVAVDGRVICAVERKSIEDLVTSLTSGRLRYALAELAALPRAAVVVEQGYSRVLAVKYVRAATVADGLAELQIRWPNVPIVHCETRKLAEEWTYRYLAAAHAWARDQPAARARAGMLSETPTTDGPPTPLPSSAELRAWARQHGLNVSDRGRIGREILEAWQHADTPLEPAVRVAGPADHRAITQLRALSTGVEADAEFEQQLSKWLSAEGDRRTTWLAWTGAQPVGMASLFEYRRMPRPGRPGSSWGYVGNMFVAETFRYRGIGSSLLAAIIDAAEERAYARLVLSPSEPSIAFYRRAGFVVPDESAGGDRLLVRPMQRDAGQAGPVVVAPGYDARRDRTGARSKGS